MEGAASSERTPTVGVFEFVIALVLISTLGRVLSRRFPRRQPQGELPPGQRAELDGIRDAMHDLSGRLQRLEEERDFYKDLLEAPGGRREISPPEGE